MPDNLLIISTNMRELPPAMFRLKADMCRLFADTADNVMHEVLLRDLADYWEQRAKEAGLVKVTSGPNLLLPPAAQLAPLGS